MKHFLQESPPRKRGRKVPDKAAGKQEKSKLLRLLLLLCLICPFTEGAAENRIVSMWKGNVFIEYWEGSSSTSEMDFEIVNSNVTPNKPYVEFLYCDYADGGTKHAFKSISIYVEDYRGNRTKVAFIGRCHDNMKWMNTSYGLVEIIGSEKTEGEDNRMVRTRFYPSSSLTDIGGGYIKKVSVEGYWDRKDDGGSHGEEGYKGDDFVRYTMSANLADYGRPKGSFVRSGSGEIKFNASGIPIQTGHSGNRVTIYRFGSSGGSNSSNFGSVTLGRNDTSVEKKFTSLNGAISNKDSYRIYVTPSSEESFQVKNGSYGDNKNVTQSLYSYFRDSYASFDIPGCAYPYSLSATPEMWKKEIKLTWLGQTANRESSGKWYIFRYKKSEGTSGRVMLGSVAISTQTYTDNSASYDTDYVYEVSYAPTSWNIQSPVSDLSTSVSANIKREFPMTASLKPTSDSLALELKWTHQAIPTVCDFSVFRSINGEEFIKLVDVPRTSATATTHSYIDKSVSSCKNYTYEVRARLLDKDFQSRQVTGNITKGTSVSSVTASKGTYGNNVKLKWTARQIGEEPSVFTVGRRMINALDEEFREIYRTSGTAESYFYDDNQATPGLHYEYQVKTYIQCNANTPASISMKTDIGFSQNSGIVSGRITYGTGIPVSDVKIYITKEDATNVTPQFYSTRVKGLGGGLFWNFNEQTGEKLFVNKPFTCQLWVRPDANVRQSGGAAATPVFVDAFKMFSILLNDYNPTSKTYRIALSLPHPEKVGETTRINTKLRIPAEAYSSLSLSNDGTGKWTVNYISNNQIFSESIESKHPLKAWNKTASSTGLSFGTSITKTDSLTFTGYVDDVRIWSKVLTNKELLNTTDRILTGNESNLFLYWPMDEGVVGYVFDISKTGGVANENHGVMGNGSVPDAIIPEPEQLSLYGFTDANGNYTIRGVPFSGDGCSYSITPIFQNHQFSPKQLTRFVNNSSLTHSEVSFSDVSSFNVSGTVYYENTTYPVEGANLYVDGTICSKDGQAILTDKQGNYTISVPIGDHFIQIKKQGHTFLDQGRYPADPNLLDIRHTFDKPIKDLAFYDNTKVTITGRVAGGEIEQSRPFGLAQGKANIGQARITLTSGYKMNVVKNSEGTSSSYDNNTEELTYTVPTDKVKSVAVVGKADDDNVRTITILTDPVTGEFAASVPPVQYTVTKVEIPSNESIKFESGQFSMLDASNPLLVKTDSVIVNEKLESFQYTASLPVIYRVEPSFTVTDKSNTVGAFGEKSYTYEDLESKQELDLYDSANGTVNYTFGYPVFIQLGKYQFSLKGFEDYVNKDNAENPVHDLVPLKNTTVTITNQMSAEQKVYVEDGKNGEKTGNFVELEDNQLKLDSLGTAIYKFTAGFPNIIEPYTRGLNIVYDNNGRQLEWSGNKTFKAIVLGSLPSGNNFVTAGPDKVLMILRDPTGTNSNAYVEKGQSFTTTEQDGGSVISQNEVLTLIKAGAESATITGTPGFGVITEVKAKADIELGTNLNYTYRGYREWTNTITATERISTSDDGDYVGAMGDLFVGSSTNLLFGNSRNVAICKNEGQFDIKKVDAMSTSTRFTTGFKYTQYYIEEVLIPNLQKVRNSLLTKVDNLNGIENRKKTPLYLTTLDPEDKRFGTDNFNTEVWGNLAVGKDKLEGPSYKMVLPKELAAQPHYEDSVRWCNSQIELWKTTLADNEMQKVKAIEGRDQWLTENHSFDAGVTIESSIETCNSMEINNAHEFETLVVAGVSSGTTIAGIGVAGTIRTQTGGGYFGSDSETSENCTTVGYTLKESGFNDALTLDVYKAPDGFGPIFRTRGGQTSCPYEGAEVTKYYKPGFEISAATMQIEIPEITVENAYATNIPSGKAGNYVLKLRNLSETDDDIWFDLALVDESNENGAILKMDGAVITDGRSILVPAGATVKKTLQLSQSDPGILDYNNIRLVLKSQCQGDPTGTRPNVADTVSISAQFIPSCSDISLAIDNRVLNARTGAKLDMKVKDYQIDYKNLKGIRIQYKGERDIDWSLAQEYVTNEADKNDNNLMLEGGSTLFTFDMSNTALYPDQTYLFRAITLCAFGNEIINNESENIEVVKDMVIPVVMGKPSPANGILTGDNEVSIVFNEPIQPSKITAVDNIRVTGVLNGYKVGHSIAMKLQSEPATTEAIINLAKKNFSVDMWLKYTKAGVVFSHGTQNKFEVAINADQKLTLNIGGNVYTSSKTVPSGKWVFLSFAYTYNETNSLFSANSAQDGPAISYFNALPVAGYEGQGRISIGKNMEGAVHEVALWNSVRSFVEAQANMYTSKKATTPNLAGYWKMNEGYGTMSKDIARSRHITIPANSWYLENENKALALNGSGYVLINTSACPVKMEEDYTFECWFRGGSENNSATLFNVNDSIINVRFRDGLLEMVAKGTLIPLSTNNYLDNIWHHLALNVFRNGNATVYVDGNSIKQLAAVEVPTIATDRIILGANRYKDATGETKYRNFFQGEMDEIRLWQATLTADVIRQNRYNRLNGDENGLVAYYPFEKKTMDAANQITTQVSFDDQSAGKAGLAESTNAVIGNEAPALSEKQPLTNVKFSYVASDNKIILHLEEDPDIIEGCTINFTVKDVRDKNNNLSQPICWSAYVQQNQLKWGNDLVNIQKEELKEYTFEAEIYNRSGVAENWSISNLPSWLSVSEESGTLQPLAHKTLNFTVNSSIPIGNYENSILLYGNNKINEAMVVKLNVSGEKPNWVVNSSDYESSMNITGQLTMNGVYQEDENDIVAAFIGDVCVGVTSPVYVKSQNGFYLFLNVYGNGNMENQEVKFRMWDATTGKIYPKVTISDKLVKFITNMVLGTIKVPVRLDASDIIEQNISLNKGWNWISTNLSSSAPSLFEQFVQSVGTKGKTMKNVTSYINYVPMSHDWNGTLNTIDNQSMYLLEVAENTSLTFEGRAVVPTAITIKPDWNWIGYQPQFPLSPEEAMASLNPSDGDVVKSKDGYAIYVADQGGWIGSLNQLSQGNGYLYKANVGGELTYPSRPLATMNRYNLNSMKVGKTNEFTPHWTSRDNYAYSMTVSAAIRIDGKECAGEEWECAAFIDDECRYSGFLKWEAGYNQWVAYISVMFNPEDVNKIVTFRVYNHLTGEVMELNKQMPAVINGNYGLTAPEYAYYLLTSKGGTGMHENAAGHYTLYPTIVSEAVHFTHPIGQISRIELADATGQLIYREENIIDQTIETGNLSEGVYFLKIYFDGEPFVYKFIKK